MAEAQESQLSQLELMQRLVQLSVERTRMSAQRSEMSEQRSYMNAERTLSVWVRTALALMIFGIAIDRFQLLLHQAQALNEQGRFVDVLSRWCGFALVALGMLMVIATGLRFLAYAHDWRRRHEPPRHHGPYLAPFFALMVAIFGAALLVIMLIFTG
jgi:putative membrane protein